METVLSYAPADFAMVSREIYSGLFAQMNRALWPAPLLALGLGVLTLLLAAGATFWRWRIVYVALALAAASVAWSFHWSQFREVNIAAPWFAALFAVEAALLTAIALWRHPGGAPGATGRALMVFAILFMPLIGLIGGRSLSEVSLAGLGPDPTAVAALGAAAAHPRGSAWLVAAPALVWCAYAAATHYARGAPVEAGATGAAALIALMVLAAGRAARGRPA